MNSNSRPPRSARNTMMDLLARRDHSEKELRNKLKIREFSDQEITRAIEFAREKSWLPNNESQNEQFSLRMAQGLHRKNKGILYINDYLKKKGLPHIKKDSELELDKALSVLENKKLKEKMKIGRFLMSRGFDSETVRQALSIYIKNNS